MADLAFLRETIADCTSESSMEYIGAHTTGQELPHWKSQLLIAHLGSMVEIDSYHSSFPWRVVLALDATWHSKLMNDMKLTWQFTTEFVDGLISKDVLYNMFSFTRYQPFRDVMTTAELLIFLHQSIFL